MRILTVRQPWAWAIMHGGKDVENRVRNIAGSYRGPVAIHAGLRFDVDAPKTVQGDFSDHPYERNEDAFGAIIGVVDLGGAHTSDYCYDWSIQYAARLYREDREAFDDLPVTNGAGGLIGRAAYCSEWALGESWHLELSNPRALAKPIPYKGALGLRTLDEATVALIAKQVTL